MTDVPESEWEAIPNPVRRSSEFGRYATRVGVVLVTTIEQGSGRGAGFQTLVTLDGDETVLLSAPGTEVDESLSAALTRHRAACRYWAKAERQAEARARIKGRRG